MRFLDRYLRKYAFWRKWRGLPEPSVINSIITKEALRILSKNLLLDLELMAAYKKIDGKFAGETTVITIRKPHRFAFSIKEEHF